MTDLKPMHATYKKIKSPIGELVLVATERGLAGILWEKERPGRVRVKPTIEDNGHPVLVETEKQLAEYFAGTRIKFDLPLDFDGTPFQQRVWTALLEIPYGETRSYAQIAREIGSPTAVRAVGAANGRNPISIIAACHRVVGSNGTLTGYAGGLPAKKNLVELGIQRLLSAPKGSLDHGWRPGRLITRTWQGGPCCCWD